VDKLFLSRRRKDVKGISKIFKWYETSKSRGFFTCIFLIFSFLLITPISSHETTQSEAKKSSDKIPSLKQQEREASSLLTQIKKEISEGNLLISQMEIITKISSADQEMQRRLRGVAQRLKLAAKDREIGAKKPKMEADIVDAMPNKGILQREIRYLKKILESVRGINSGLKKKDVGITQNTKDEAKKFYLSLKKAAEETNKEAQKKKSSS
jgi:hypothetical protein